MTIELQNWLNHIATEISNSWNLWQADVQFGGVSVSGSGIGAWSGTGSGGSFDTELALTISPLYGTDGEKKVFDSISKRFTDAFNEWVNSFTFDSVVYNGTSTATGSSAGTFSAIGSDTLLSTSGKTDKLSMLSDDVCNDTGFNLEFSKFKEFMDAVQVGLLMQFGLWRGTTTVGGDSVSGTAAITTGTGSATSNDDGII